MQQKLEPKQIYNVTIIIEFSSTRAHTQHRTHGLQYSNPPPPTHTSTPSTPHPHPLPPHTHHPTLSTKVVFASKSWRWEGTRWHTQPRTHTPPPMAYSVPKRKVSLKTHALQGGMGKMRRRKRRRRRRKSPSEDPRFHLRGPWVKRQSGQNLYLEVNN